MLHAVAALGRAAGVVGGDIAEQRQHLVHGAVADGVDRHLHSVGQPVQREK